jgi:hypothetical protein
MAKFVKIVVAIILIGLIVIGFFFFGQNTAKTGSIKLLERQCKTILSDYQPNIFSLEFNNYKSDNHMLPIETLTGETTTKFDTSGDIISESGPFLGSQLREESVSIIISDEGLEGCRLTEYFDETPSNIFENQYSCDGFDMFLDQSAVEEYYVVGFDTTFGTTTIRNVYVFNTNLVEQLDISIWLDDFLNESNCVEVN